MSQMPPPPQWLPPPDQLNRDSEHLRLLSIFHYVLAGIVGLCACIPLIHVTIGVLMVSGRFPLDGGGQGPPPEFGWIFVIMGSVFVLGGWTTAILLLSAAGRLRKRRNWTYCFVVACIGCLFMPLGTVLGVFTILTLSRPTVKAMFGQTA